MLETVWVFENRRSGEERSGTLSASWEVEYDPMSDDYTPDEMPASELLQQWVAKVQPRYNNGLVPITWYVRGDEIGIFEFMPAQFRHIPELDIDFLTYFTLPENSETGESLKWLSLPVVDKLWNAKQAHKGGFIQEATGWKPGILQPFVYLPTLWGTSNS